MAHTLASPSRSNSPYDWAEHLIWMEGGTLPGSPTDSGPRSAVWPGVLLASLFALAAFALSGALSRSLHATAMLLDPVLLSMLLGLAAGNLIARRRADPGMTVMIRRVLPVGIVLLGARMNFSEALRIGLPGLGLSLAVVALAIGLLYGFRHALGLEKKFALLLGIGTGICGGTAIVAVAPLLRARERDVVLGVALVTLTGLITMLALPPIGSWLDLSARQFGLLAGLTIHQTPQVIAAGIAYGEEAGQVATVAKLARVCLLAPVAAVLGWIAARHWEAPGSPGGGRRWYQFLPWFAVGFLAMAGLRSLGWLPEIAVRWEDPVLSAETLVRVETADLLKTLSAFLLASAMVAVGYQTRLNSFREIGARPFVAAGLASLFIGLFVLAFVLTAF